MATVKSIRAARMNMAAERLDHLAGNARILRDPAAWKTYNEAVRITGMLGFRVTQHDGHHEVTPC